MKPAVWCVVERLLTLDSVMVEHDARIASALQLFRASRPDFADGLIATCARPAGCTRTVTFDKIAPKDLGMELLK